MLSELCPYSRSGDHDWTMGPRSYQYVCQACKAIMNDITYDSALEETAPRSLERPSWPETWMAIAHQIAKRSYDPRLKVGCIIVSDDNTMMLACGYNGNARGLPNVPESLDPGQSGFLHAELNAAIKCDFNFPKKKHAYCTHSTCRACAKILINLGVSLFVYDELYRDQSGLDVLRTGGIEVCSLSEAVERAS